jgi:hypothetical protein
MENYKGRKIPNEAWNRIAVRLGRTVCSVHTKATKLRKFGLDYRIGAGTPSSRTSAGAKSAATGRVQRHKRKNLEALIDSALRNLPSGRGTKAEICEKVKELHPEHLVGQWQTSVKQLLNIKYSKIAAVYQLESSDLRAIKLPHQCHSMADYIRYALSQGPATLPVLKDRIRLMFGEWLNGTVTAESELTTWEKTMLKKLSSVAGVTSTPTLFTTPGMISSGSGSGSDLT